MSMEQGRLDWVQALRGIAAMLVVLCHALDYLSHSPSFPLIESALLPGAMGVDLFFIISGFIMVYSTRKTTGTLDDVKNFAINRFSRIWPTYAVVSIIWIFIAYDGINYFISYENWAVLFKSLTFIPVKEMAPLYFEPVFPLGWTLNFEMYFYVVFAVSLLFKRYRLAAMLIWIAFTVILIPMLTRTFSTNPFTYYSYELNYFNLMTNPIILEFVAGAAIGYLYLSRHVQIASKSLALNFLALSIALVVWFNYSGPASTHGITNWGGPLSVMVLAFAICSKTVHIKSPKILIWLGKISYSLYLTHYLTRAAMDHAVGYLGFSGHVHTWGYFAFSVSVSVSVAALSQYILEQKLSNRLRDELHKRMPFVRVAG
ncbi:acyltransferase [Pseudomonas sp. GBPI_506]|uniref:acyltransferase family protein n=1 Tax=Pseudomonas sp. GBPI_506 TaxID=1735795 RepID=UPI0020CF601C|nr:acyltransferase [Pseudomonas sp. GBPI_506]MCP9731583.1 acyltransferase [Pseudomonas sp. GBPI_506]